VCVERRAHLFSSLGAGTLLLAAEEGGQGHVRHLHNLEPVEKNMFFKISLDLAGTAKKFKTIDGIECVRTQLKEESKKLAPKTSKNKIYKFFAFFSIPIIMEENTGITVNSQNRYMFFIICLIYI
jgi:hypothetical protein